MTVRTFAALLAAATAVTCGDSPSSPTPLATESTVRIVFQGSTSRRTDLSVAAQVCVSGAGATHIHPSWRAYNAFPLQAVPPDRYEITLNDVPVTTRVSFRVNDQNFCDENPTGAVTRDIFANGVRLAQNATTPGVGDEPGYAFSVSSTGTISQ